MVKVTDCRGWQFKEKAEENKEKVRAFFEANPGATRGDAAEKLKMHRATVSKHLVELGMV